MGYNTLSGALTLSYTLALLLYSLILSSYSSNTLIHSNTLYRMALALPSYSVNTLIHSQHSQSYSDIFIHSGTLTVFLNTLNVRLRHSHTLQYSPSYASDTLVAFLRHCHGMTWSFRLAVIFFSREIIFKNFVSRCRGLKLETFTL